MTNSELSPDFFTPVTEITGEGAIIHFSDKPALLCKILNNLRDPYAPDLDLDMDKFMESLTDGEVRAFVDLLENNNLPESSGNLDSGE